MMDKNGKSSCVLLIGGVPFESSRVESSRTVYNNCVYPTCASCIKQLSDRIWMYKDATNRLPITQQSTDRLQNAHHLLSSCARRMACYVLKRHMPEHCRNLKTYLFIIWRNEIAPVTIQGRAESCFDQECRGCCKTIAEKR
jgi:hypothetical protein